MKAAIIGWSNKASLYASKFLDIGYELEYIYTPDARLPKTNNEVYGQVFDYPDLTDTQVINAVPDHKVDVIYVDGTAGLTIEDIKGFKARRYLLNYFVGEVSAKTLKSVEIASEWAYSERLSNLPDSIHIVDYFYDPTYVCTPTQVIVSQFCSVSGKDFSSYNDVHRGEENASITFRSGDQQFFIVCQRFDGVDPDSYGLHIDNERIVFDPEWVTKIINEGGVDPANVSNILHLV